MSLSNKPIEIVGGEGERDRLRDRETERQTERQRDRETERLRDRETERKTENQSEWGRHRDWELVERECVRGVRGTG